jgi:hypothetical protein
MRAMTDQPAHGLGQGPLRITTVLRHAAGMFGMGRSRVALVALIVFGFPALITSVAEEWVTHLSAAPGLAATVLLIAAVLVTATLRLFGPVLFSGYLDEAVGREYFSGHLTSFNEVLRKLPLIRLLAADFLVTIGTGFGLSLFVVPGILFYMLFGLVGPVIVQEERGLTDAFRRTFSISRTALLFVALLLVIPTAFELVLHAFAYELAHGAWIGVTVLMEWLVAAVVGGSIGLLEVALAAELMARNPEPPPVMDENA